jgi:hypothetical protein
MKKHLIISIIVVACAAFVIWMLCGTNDGQRVWTNTSGSMITAEILALKDGKATLKMSNGKEIEIALSSLITADAEFARLWQKTNQAGAATTLLEGPGAPVATESMLED